MYFEQDGAIFTQYDKPLKLVDQFTYLSRNISSTESNANKHIVYISIGLITLLIK